MWSLLIILFIMKEKMVLIDSMTVRVMVRIMTSLRMVMMRIMTSSRMVIIRIMKRRDVNKK